MKTIRFLCLLLLMASLAACDSAATPTALPATDAPPPPTATMEPPTEIPIRPTATPTVQPPTATARPTATVAPTATAASLPTAMPTEPLPSEITQLPLVEIPSDHPAALLSMLPGRASQFIFVNIETAMERPAFEDLFQEMLRDFVDGEKSPDAELFRSAGVGTMAVGFDDEWEWYCILSGDFTLMQEALRLAAAKSGGSPFTELIEEHQGVEIFGVFLERSYAQRDVLYLAMPYRDTLMLTKDFERMQEMVGRRVNGGSLPASLVVMIEDWGLPDYLHVFGLGGSLGDGLQPPLDTLAFYGVRVTLEEDENTTLSLLYQFESDTQATEAVSYSRGQTESGATTIGYNKKVQLSRWAQRGPAVYAHVTVPDEESIDLIGDVTFGN